jgi:hypothetical protein
VCDAQGEELGSQHPKLFEALQINVPAVYGLIESFVRARVSACIILTYCCTCINVCLRARTVCILCIFAVRAQGAGSDRAQ